MEKMYVKEGKKKHVFEQKELQLNLEESLKRPDAAREI